MKCFFMSQQLIWVIKPIIAVINHPFSVVHPHVPPVMDHINQTTLDHEENIVGVSTG